MMSRLGNGGLAWALAYAAFLALMLLTGGISVPSTPVIYLHSLASLAIIAIALWRLIVLGFPSRLSVVGAVLILAALALVLLQLAPLPESIWGSLPYRDIVRQNLQLLQRPAEAMPLSLTPENTRLSALALLPAVAAYFGALTIPDHRWKICILAIFGCAAIGILFALVQFFQGATSPFFLYVPEEHKGLGTFNNGNFFAAQLYCTLIFVGAFMGFFQDRRFVMAAVFCAVFGSILLAALALTGSRAGILLSMLAIALSLFLVMSRHSIGGKRRPLVALVFMLAGILIVGQASMVGLLKITNAGLVDKMRLDIAARSIAAMKETWLWGGGLGSFTPLYQLSETPRSVTPAYINHVHNDWLEVALETGLPGVILGAFFLILLLVASIWIIGRGPLASNTNLQKAGLFVVMLLGLHSLVDFPLRTPALLGLFAMSCGLITLAPMSLVAHSHARRGHRGNHAKAFRSRPELFATNKGAQIH